MDNKPPFLLDAEGFSQGPITVRLAKNAAELEAAQRLRYQVFYEECGATPTGDMVHTKRDSDAFDAFADHLIVIDTDKGEVVGNYRLLREDASKLAGKFYTEDEYKIDKMLLLGKGYLLELGRSCIHPDYRTRNVLQILWQGIAEYISQYNIKYLFGCASFSGNDPAAVADCLSYLYHNHRAPQSICPQALHNDRYVDMHILPNEGLDPRDIFSKLPPLLKGYLRVGAFIGDGAFIDKQFNTIDVCVVVDTALLPERYKKHYDRRMAEEVAHTNQSFTGKIGLVAV